jgi:homoserine kinase
MRARAPGSAANLGPGFDALAVALGLHVEVEVVPAEELVVRSEGEGSELACDRSHLAARVATSVAGHDRLSITVRSSIPVARGLGSSAALAVAAAAAAGSPDPLAVGAAFDGHAENAAASAMGGLVAAAMVEGAPVALPLRLDPELAFVLLVPERRLDTPKARHVLPAQVGLDDAAFNLGRMGLLVGGLADSRLLRPQATEDRLHQPARSMLFPEARSLMDGLVEAGALAACWSGAGPSLLGICRRSQAEDLVRAGSSLMQREGVEGTARLVEADTAGLVVSA